MPQPYEVSNPEKATQLSRESFNDQNQQERDRFVLNPNENCDYIVDLVISVDDMTDLEPDFARLYPKIWKHAFSAKFLDAKQSHPIFRAFYFPLYSEEFCVYNNYTLYKNARKI